LNIDSGWNKPSFNSCLSNYLRQIDQNNPTRLVVDLAPSPQMEDLNQEISLVDKLNPLIGRIKRNLTIDQQIGPNLLHSVARIKTLVLSDCQASDVEMLIAPFSRNYYPSIRELILKPRDIINLRTAEVEKLLQSSLEKISVIFEESNENRLSHKALTIDLFKKLGEKIEVYCNETKVTQALCGQQRADEDE
jgi:hypothetical protein